MKILVFYRSLQQGGVQKMMVNFVNYFHEKGNDVTLLLIYREGDFLPLVNEGVKIVSFESNKKTAYLSILKNELKVGNYDLLFTATPTLNVLSLLAKKLSGAKTKIIISERSDAIQEFRMGGFSAFKILFLLIPFTYRWSNAIVAVSKGVAARVKQLTFLPADRIKVIYNPAYDKNIFLERHGEIEDDWLVNKRCPVIVSAGRLAYEKNYQLLIRAVSLVISKGIPLKLIIIGTGTLKDDLERLIDSLNLNDNVKLVGFQPVPSDWITKSDLYVLPSLWEGFGNILVEALACGTTIVATNCPSGPAEILENGNYGYLIDSYEPEPMADAIIDALENPMDPDKLKHRAEFFEKNKIMREYESLIDSIL